MDKTVISLSIGDVFYMDTGGDGPVVVFIHGNSQSSDGFVPVMKSSLGDQYRIIAPDLPGHGDSSWSENPENSYTFEGFADFLVEFAEFLELSGAIWVGHSLGGHILLDSWTLLPEPSAMLIYGTAPLAIPPAFSEAYPPNPGIACLFSSDTDSTAAEELARTIAGAEGVADTLIVTDFLRTDPAVRNTLGKITDFSVDEAVLIRDISVPIAIFQGENDTLVSMDYLNNLRIPHLWRGGVQIIPRAGHGLHMGANTDFIELLEDFTSDIFG